MSVTEDTLALAVMDDDGFGCAIITAPEPRAWRWPAGKTFGQLSPAERLIASRRSARQLQDHLERAAPAITEILEQEENKLP
jgi:hypothetical protein